MWGTDNTGGGGKGHVVVKFSPQGKVLMTLGKPGVAGLGPDLFNAPTDVAVAANGEIIVSDGHGGDTNARIVKFTSDGKFIAAWGKRGSGPGEFGVNHSLAIDSAGRIYVADRGNSRVEIFDPNGAYIGEWKQFGRPSGLFIDKNDILYVTDLRIQYGAESGLPARRPHRQRQGRQGHGLHPGSRSAEGRNRRRQQYVVGIGGRG